MRRHVHAWARDGICVGCGISREEFKEIAEEEVRDMEAENIGLHQAFNEALRLLERVDELWRTGQGGTGARRAVKAFVERFKATTPSEGGEGRGTT
jgi:hypothetical protein